MKKVGRLLIIIIVLGAIGYGFYMIFVMPKGFVNKEDLAQSYFENISSSTLCEKHYSPETLSNCEEVKQSFSGETITVSNVSSFGDTVTVTITLGDNDETFDVTFIKEDNSGIKAIFNKAYYFIDTIV